MSLKPSKIDYLILFSLGALWGSSFGAIKIALYSFSPLTVMSARIILAGAALLILTLVRGSGFPSGIDNWVKIFWMALLGTLIPFFLVPWGQQQVSSSLSSIIMAINPLFALILGHFFSRNEIFTLRKLLSIFVGFSGVVLVFGENVFSAISVSIWSQLAIIFAGIGYTISGVIATRLYKVTADSASAAIFTCASIIIFPIWILIEKPWELKFETESLIALTHLGIVSTGLAFLMRYYLIFRTGAVFLSYVAFIIPMFGIFFGIFFLEESISTHTFGAVLLILLGVYLGRK